MKGSVVKCDQCHSEEVRYENTFGGAPRRNWITVSRVESMSKDKVGAGTHHFCKEKCLLEWLAR